MEINQTKAEGLSRTFQVTVPAEELEERLGAKINELIPQMKLKGFRPGKVPPSHVRKMYGRSIMSDIVQDLVGEATDKAITDAEVRPASEPQPEFDGALDDVIAGKADLSYRFDVDVMPDFEVKPFDGIEIERPVAVIPEAEIDEALDRIAKGNTKFESEEGRVAADGDAVMIDYLGKIDGEPFEGGASGESEEGTPVVIGEKRFIPGFEEQLIGAKAGEARELQVTFPEDYNAAELAGKDAVFEVTVRDVRAPTTPEVDDEFAKGLGADDLPALREMVSGQLSRDYDTASRSKAKRALLDALDDQYDFDLPPGMVKQELDQILSQIEQEKAAGRIGEEDAEKSADELREEYGPIAERRVRLGLVLAEIGRGQDVKITQQEEQGALIAEARKFPGQERQVLEFFQKNPGAMAQIRAPIYEEKVVDYLLGEVTVTDKTVSKDELFAEDEDEDGAAPASESDD